ncbi:MAG: hypothetical protein ACRD3I_11055, partial [Terriglobales bacterium]
MEKILIRQCTLRIVRHGGWNWGSDPAGLVRGAVARLGELLERKLPEFWPDDEDFEIAAPVRIRVPVSFRELLDKRSGHFNETGLPGSFLDERLERAIDAAFGPFASFVAPASSPLTTATPDETRSEPHETAPPIDVAERIRREAGPQSRASLQRLLWSWRKRDVLAAILADFSPQALEAWHHRLLASVGEFPAVRANQTPDDIEEVVRTIAEEAGEYVFPARGRSPDRTALMRLRLYVAAEVAAYFEIQPHHPVLLKALDHVLPLTDPKVAAEVRGASGSPPAMAATTAVVLTPKPWQGEFAVSSALPFLLLGPLSRIGYLDALAAILEVTGLSQAAPLFAQALAYKVLAPPERGWRHRQADIAAATVF